MEKRKSSRKRRIERKNRLDYGFFKENLPNHHIDPDEEYLYHITTTEELRKIVEYGGVVGSRGVYTSLAELGYLYTVNTEEERVWNAVSFMQIIRSKSDCFGGRHGKPFQVIAIPISFFDENSMVIEEDMKGESVTHYHRKVDLMGNTIPLDQICYAGQFITDGKDYHIFKKELVGRLFGVDGNQVSCYYDLFEGLSDDAFRELEKYSIPVNLANL